MPLPVGPVTRIMPCGAASACAQLGLQLRPEAEIGEIAALGALVQDADDQALAVHRGCGGDAQVDAAAEQGQPGAAVLRQAALGDVELGQDLDARDHRGRQPRRRCAGLAQPAVDAVAHAQMVARGLDVDVRGVQAQGVGEQLVDQPHHRCLLGGADQVLDVGAELAGQILADVVDDPLQRRLPGVPVARIGLLQVLQRHDHRHHAALDREPDRLDRVAVAGVGHGQPDRVVGRPHRQDGGVLAGSAARPVGEQRLARQVVGTHQLEIVVARYRLGPVAAGDQPQAGDRGGQALALLLCGRGRAHGGVGRDPAGQHQPRQDRIELARARVLERRRGVTGRSIDYATS